MPQSDGHTLVMPKAPARNFFDIEPAVLAELIKATQHVARGVQKAFNPGGMRIMQFNETVAGQTVFHIHFHIIPCYEGVPLRSHNRDWADKAVLAQHAERVPAGAPAALDERNELQDLQGPRRLRRARPPANTPTTSACTRSRCATRTAFWARIGRRLDWIQPYTKVKDTSFDEQDFRIRWFADGKLNVAVNCLDRHLAKRGDKTAIIFEGDDPRAVASASPIASCTSASAASPTRCEALGVQQGRPRHDLPADDSRGGGRDARLRAHRRGPFGRVRRLLARVARRPHRRLRLELVITADEGLRGGKRIPLKANVDAALALPGTDCVKHVLVVRRTGAAVADAGGARSLVRRRASTAQPKDCAPEPMNAEDPLFILYTSGSTGKPKGVLHTTGGYLRVRVATRTSWSSTCARTTSTGARPTSAGSPATATSSTGRSRTARPR